jgi:type I restriction enzyme, R subunit
MRESETRRELILPKLKSAGWVAEQIREEYPITSGRIVASTRRHRVQQPLRADYVLEHQDDLPIAVVEAKRTSVNEQDGIEQARRYAQRLDLPIAYATNGKVIHEIVIGGPITKRLNFPTPDELWERFCNDTGVDSEVEKAMLGAPFDRSLRDNNLEWKRPRYYQRVAVNRTLRAIAHNKKRILLVLATGTGKTMVALQLVAKLRNSGWIAGRKPRVLYLADRNILVDQPKDDYFSPAFGDVVHKISRSHAQRSREVYFALYQSLEQGSEQALYKQYPKDYFELIIVDECHRGSAADTSQWRAILDYYDQAVQIGMTATPIDRKDAATFGYFGNPVYEYSLRDGIEDGFLAPYRVRRASLNVDVLGYQPEPGKLDTDGEPVPPGLYTPRQYERVIAILDRTDVAARYLTEYMRSTGRMRKTIVFCENNDHAGRMRNALNNANLDMVAQYPNYVCRVTNADGDAGLAQLDDFGKISTDEPIIVVTSQLLTTGIDLPSVENIVIFRRIASMPLFKQIIGRGTRLCSDIHKGSFDIIDFTDSTRLFHDPAFDGPPLRLVDEEINTDGDVVECDTEPTDGVVAEPEAPYEVQDQGEFPEDPEEAADQADRVMAQGRRIYVDDVETYVWNERYYQLDPDGQTLRLVEYRELVRDQIISLKLSPVDLRTRWAVAKSRTALVEALQDQAIDPEDLPAKLGYPEADPIDLLISVAWDLPVVSRGERAGRVRREHREFLNSFGPQARAVLDALLEKFTEYGAMELTTSALRVHPFTEMGNIGQIGALFGGPEQLRAAVDHLGEYLFDVANYN